MRLSLWNYDRNRVTDSLVSLWNLFLIPLPGAQYFLPRSGSPPYPGKNGEGFEAKDKSEGDGDRPPRLCDLTTKTIEKVLELVLIEGKVDDAVLLVKNTINRHKNNRRNKPAF